MSQTENNSKTVRVGAAIFRVADATEETLRSFAYKGVQVLLVHNGLSGLWELPKIEITGEESEQYGISGITFQYFKEPIRVYTQQLLTTVEDRDVTIYSLGAVTDKVEMVNNKADWFWVWGYGRLSSNGKCSMQRSSDGSTDIKISNSDYEIVNSALLRIAGKLMYTSLGFRFMEETFTLRDLENCFNALNDRAISGFRRKILKRVEPTNIKSAAKAYRPALLYREKQE